MSPFARGALFGYWTALALCYPVAAVYIVIRTGSVVFAALCVVTSVSIPWLYRYAYQHNVYADAWYYVTHRCTIPAHFEPLPRP